MQYHGSCACGAVTFTCEGDPLFTQYCHCHKCREVMSFSQRASDKIGYALTAAYLTAHFTLNAHAKLDEITRNNARLFLCSTCQSLIYGISLDPALQAGIGVNANNFIWDGVAPDSFKPVRHIWYASHVVPMHDDLPKYRDAPKEQFGTGEMYGEDT